MNPIETPFLGIAYSDRSKRLADQQLINLYLEMSESKGGSASPGAFFGCPGLVKVATVGTGPIRGMFPAHGSLYVASGGAFYSVASDYTSSALGNLATSAGPVSIISNPTQVAVFDGTLGYALSGGSFSSIALPFTNPGIAAYLDGFGVVNQIGTQNIWQSNLNDLTTWGALNFAVENGVDTKVVAATQFHQQLVISLETHTTFYVNAGLNGFVFQRLVGVYPEIGCVAPYSITQLDEAVCWLGQDINGLGTVYIMKGYEPERISTSAIEYAISQYPTITDAVGYSYNQSGHQFYLLMFPSGGQTWCLDLTETRKIKSPCWHQRASFSNGQFGQFAGSCAASFNGKILLGDNSSGNIYSLDLNTYTDNGNPRKWLRSWRALPHAVYEPTRFNFLELNYESGINVPPASNPQFVLRWSDDAYNWSAERFQSAGVTGATANIARWNSLGMTRRGNNSDRIFELSSTDPFKVALLGATIG